MSEPIVYLNGEYLPLNEAKISVLDRGFMFGDGIYEVIPVFHRQLFRLTQHLQRLQNSLDGVRISNPHTQTQWQTIFNTLIAKNSYHDQSLYLQVTRGVAKRDHFFPKNVTPTVFAMTNPLIPTDSKTFMAGIAAITLDDIRWQYCHIKAITLLPNVLMRQTAADQHAYEAILIRHNQVTEGAASNVFIVKDGLIKTPPKGQYLLPGVTRDLVVELAQQHQLAYQETHFTPAELAAADEIWMTGSIREILPVVKLDGKIIGNGSAGPITQRINDIYQAYKASLAS